MKKNFALRVDSEVYDAIEKWAADEFRSANGQIEWILSEALKKAKRYPKKTDMKKSLIIIMLLLGMGAQAQWYTGWSTKTGLVMSLHLTDSVAELYSPLQSSIPIPITQRSLRMDTLRLQCPSVGLSMALAENDSNMQGYWRQGMLRENITFTPADTIFIINRPQVPQPPYSFDEEAIVAQYVDSHGDSVFLSGTLTYPHGGGRYPTVVLVSGSGQQNRDEELMQHKPFLVLADYLASRGIAVLRYDDRGVGESRGSLDRADTRLFAEDAEAMLEAVRKNKHVDRRLLGIGGHSEGGAIAGLVASRNKHVRFIVMLAGQGCSGLDILLQQNEAIYQANGVSGTLLNTRMACLRELFALPSTATLNDYRFIIKHHTEGLTTAQKDSIGLGRGAAAALQQQQSTPWMQSFIRLDPAEYLPSVACPILALNGSLDLQVLAQPNIERIRQLTKHRADCRILPGLNHLFQHCTTGSPDEYVRIEETFAPEAMQAIADWIISLRK